MAASLFRPLVPEGFAVPRGIRLAGLTLWPLGLEDAARDFEAVTESTDRLKGLFAADDVWPTGLTLRQNTIDLAWHEKEFQQRTSFAWGLWLDDAGREGRGLYCGTAYLYPDVSGAHDALAFHWLRTRLPRPALAAGFSDAWLEWVSTAWPFSAVAFRAAPWPGEQAEAAPLRRAAGARS